MSGKHHKYSPSKLDRIAACPGSVMVCERVRGEMTDIEWDNHTSSEAAIRGTELHEALATGNDPDDTTVDEQELLAECREYKEMHFSDCDEVWVEHHVALMDGFEVVTEGTADVIGINRKDQLLKLLDWKTGRLWCDPNGYQLRAYGAAAMQTFDIDTVEGHIFQPRAGKGKPILFSSFDEIFNEVRAVIRAAQDPHAPLVPGDQCNFCPAKATCSACENLETSLTQTTESALSDPRRLGQAAEVAKVVIKRCEALLAKNKEATIAGEATGWKIVSRQGRASIADANVALQRLQPHITRDDFLAIMSIPIGQLTEIIAARLKESDGLTKKESTEWIVARLGDCLQRAPDQEICVVDKKARE